MEVQFVKSNKNYEDRKIEKVPVRSDLVYL